MLAQKLKAENKFLKQGYSNEELSAALREGRPGLQLGIEAPHSSFSPNLILNSSPFEIRATEVCRVRNRSLAWLVWWASIATHRLTVV